MFKLNIPYLAMLQVNLEYSTIKLEQIGLYKDKYSVPKFPYIFTNNNFKAYFSTISLF